MASTYPILTILARIFLAILFIGAGVSKAMGYEGFQDYMESGGIPGILAPLVILLEIGGGIMVLIGFKARWAALALAAFSVLAAVLYHADFGNQTQMAMFMKNLAVAGGLLLIVVHGPGAYSVDKD